MTGYLVLADGTVFSGSALGAGGENRGEVVFNTTLTGYRKMLTDPANYGLIVVMTNTLIGNYGVNDNEVESDRVKVAGLIVRECIKEPNHWESHGTLGDYLEKQGIICLEGVDTRRLTRHLRQNGSMTGAIVTGLKNEEELAAAARELAEAGRIKGSNPIAQVSTREVYTLKPKTGNGRRLVVVDLGTRRTVLNSLTNLGYEVVVVPYNCQAEDIKDLKPDGIIYYGGPGDPTVLEEVAAAARGLIKTGRPILGIGSGHLVLGKAVGAAVSKMAFGHRGGYPVKNIHNGVLYITGQNHGYELEEDSLDAGEVTVTLRNLNDGTIEGLKMLRFPVFTTQYTPPAWESPAEVEYPYDKFLKLVG